MMIRREQETDNFTKEESNTTSHDHDHENTKNKGTTSTTTTTISSWSRLKDPRIVRVSRAFGGKDRHSKVCTVRGLRDRRVRLSVPTAIQLYDLQERLGLNQPSKVVDWLLNAAKHEIDELPPLQIPPGTFTAQMLADSDQPKQGLSIFGGKLKEVSGENSTHQEEIRQFNLANAFVSSGNNNNPASSSSSMSNLMNSNSFIRWDPASNLTLSSHQNDQDWHNFSLVPLQQTISHHHQVLVYQPGTSTTQSYFPQNINPATNSDQQMNFHNSPVQSTNATTTHFNMSTANLLPSHNNQGRS